MTAPKPADLDQLRDRIERVEEALDLDTPSPSHTQESR